MLILLFVYKAIWNVIFHIATSTLPGRSTPIYHSHMKSVVSCSHLIFIRLLLAASEASEVISAFTFLQYNYLLGSSLLGCFLLELGVVFPFFFFFFSLNFKRPSKVPDIWEILKKSLKDDLFSSNLSLPCGTNSLWLLKGNTSWSNHRS